jgi:hypothetical protein
MKLSGVDRLAKAGKEARENIWFLLLDPNHTNFNPDFYTLHPSSCAMVVFNLSRDCLGKISSHPLFPNPLAPCGPSFPGGNPFVGAAETRTKLSQHHPWISKSTYAPGPRVVVFTLKGRNTRPLLFLRPG